jgi:hypothetical protein
MRIIEILAYQPDDPTEQERDADAAMMRWLADRFTARRGLVKALTGFGSDEHQGSGPVSSQPGINAEIGRVPVANADDPLNASLSSGEWDSRVRENPGLRRSARSLPVYRLY